MVLRVGRRDQPTVYLYGNRHERGFNERVFVVSAGTSNHGWAVFVVEVVANDCPAPETKMQETAS